MKAGSLVPEFPLEPRCMAALREGGAQRPDPEVEASSATQGAWWARGGEQGDGSGGFQLISFSLNGGALNATLCRRSRENATGDENGELWGDRSPDGRKRR